MDGGGVCLCYSEYRGSMILNSAGICVPDYEYLALHPILLHLQFTWAIELRR